MKHPVTEGTTPPADGPNLAGVPLTPRERRIMGLTAAGMTLAGIGFELGIPERTVRRNRERIYEKFGVATVGQAVAVWLGREALSTLIENAKGKA